MKQVYTTTTTMAEIESVLIHLTNRELNEASNYATRSTIKLRVLLKIADMLGLSLQSIYETKSLIRVHVTISKFIENKWMQFYSSCRSGGKNSFNINLKASNPTHTTTNASSSSNTNIFNSLPTSDEWATLERFLAKDFARNVDLIRLTAVLKKRLPEQDLNFIFAVDGLHSIDTTTTTNDTVENIHSNLNDYRQYFENLSVPLDAKKDDEEDMDEDDAEAEPVQEECPIPIGWYHVKAVRAIYTKVKNATPEHIGNVLKKIYRAIEHGESASKPISSVEVYLSDSDSESEDETETEHHDALEKGHDTIEEAIEKIYRKHVREKLAHIASWKKMEMERVKEGGRKRKPNSNEHDSERRNKPGRPSKKNKLSSNDEKRDHEENREKMTQEQSLRNNDTLDPDMKNDDAEHMDQDNENLNVVIVKKKKVLDKKNEYAVVPPKKKKTCEK